MLSRLLKPDSLLSDAFQTLVIRLVGITLMFVMTTLTARFLGAAEFGTFSAAWALAILLATLAPLGSDRILVRNLSTVGSADKAGPEIALAHLCTAMSALVIAALAAAVALWPDNSLFPSSWRETTLLAAILSIPIALTYLRQWVALPLIGTRHAVIPEQTILPVVFTGTVLALHVLAGPLTASVALTVLASTMLLVWAGSLRHPALRQAYRSAWSAWPGTTVLGERIQDGLPFVSLSIGAVVLQRSLPLVIAATCGFHSAALFAMALQYAAIPEIPLGIVNLCMIPRCARHYQQGELTEASHVVRVAATMTVGLTLVLAAVTYLVGPLLLPLLGKSFEGIGAIFPTLLLAALVNAVVGPATPVMQTMKLEAAYSRALYLFLPVQLGLIWAGSRVAEVEGAAMGYLAARVVWAVLILQMIRKALGISCLPYGSLRRLSQQNRPDSLPLPRDPRSEANGVSMKLLSPDSTVLCLTASRSLNKRMALFITGALALAGHVRVLSLPRGTWSRNRFETAADIRRLTAWMMELGQASSSRVGAVFCFHWFMLPLAVVVSRICRAPLVYDEHDHYELNSLEGHGPRVVRRCTSLMVRIVHRLFLPYAHTVTCIRLKGGLLRKHLLRWQSNVVELHNYPVREWVLSSTPPPAAGPVTFLYVGGIFREKGAQLIADAFRELQKSGDHSASLHFFGTGDSQLLATLGEQEGVHLHGNQAPEDIRRFVVNRRSCGLIIFPPHRRYDLIGTNTRKLFEYLASAMPVIATSSGDIGRIIAEADCGLVLPSDCSAAALAAAMRQMAENSGRFARWAQNARDHMAHPSRSWEAQWDLVAESLTGQQRTSSRQDPIRRDAA